MGGVSRLVNGFEDEKTVIYGGEEKKNDGDKGYSEENYSRNNQDCIMEVLDG